MPLEPAGITHHTAVLNGIRQHWVAAGEGPPLYLLHGFPETWFAWRKMIPALAEHYTVIAPDLRGYGATQKPSSGYDKRTMALDTIALMDHLGHDKISLVGHDRGARVGTRFAKDHRDRINRLVVMENIPTRVIAETFDIAKARLGYWFFPFLGLADLPEALITGKEEIFFTYFLRGWCYNPELLSQEELDVYINNYKQPGAVRGSCADYGAAPEDVAQDLEDVDELIDCPVLSMWGRESVGVGQAYDVAEVWRTMAHDLQTFEIAECSHLPPEEQPEVVTEAVLRFLAE